jgi:Undecaprenyl-phosphate galactose phosphotransferase WbaP
MSNLKTAPTVPPTKLPRSPQPDALKHHERPPANLKLATPPGQVAAEHFVTNAGAHQEFSQKSNVLRSFISADISALLLGFFISRAIANWVNYAFFGRSVPDIFSHDELARLVQMLFVSGGILLWFEHTGHYRVRMPFWIETRKIAGAFVFATIIDGFLQFASKQDFSRLWLMLGWGIAALLTLGFRALTRTILRRQGKWTLRTLIVGDGDRAKAAHAGLSSEPGLGYEIVAQFGDIEHALDQADYSWIKLCAQYTADHVVVALDGLQFNMAETAIAQLMREPVSFSIAPPLRFMPVVGLEPHYFLNHDVMLLTHDNRLEQPLAQFIKRSFDLAVATAVLTVVSIPMLIIAALVKSDGGPALFGQKRIGMNGKVFICFKFRSMVRNADEVLKQHLDKNPNVRADWDKYCKLRQDQDPRVTRVGKTLRKFSLDELPQLLNVLMGSMSLVGPRPIIIAELPRYARDIAYYNRVRPGITGLWTVSGRNNVTYAQRVKMDSWYVRNWSLWHDIVILCKTVPVLLNRSGAY